MLASLLTQESGLKSITLDNVYALGDVSPYTGEWIEIGLHTKCKYCNFCLSLHRRVD